MLRLLRPFAGTDRLLVLLFVLGAALRALYAAGTPFDERAYDAVGHIEYLRHVALTLSIPPSQGGFLFHHAPLYYLIGGLYWAAADALGLGAGQVLGHLQLLSLVLSLGTLGAGMAALRRALKDPAAVAMGCALLACFPGLAMLSSRVTDDALYATLSVLSVLLLLRWWRHGSRGWWIALWICVSLSVLTKASGLTMAAAALACLALRRTPNLRRKVALALTGLAILVATTGWYQARRLTEPGAERALTFGNVLLNGRLGVTNEPDDYLTFNPAALLRTPFVSPWLDETRRANLWEYLLRSSLFGEFTYQGLRPLATVLLLAAMLSLPVMAWGVWTSRALKAAVPMATVAVLLLASMLAYRLLFPNASNQDFRFVPALAVPAAFYAASGFSAMRKLLRDAVGALLTFFCVVAAALLATLGIGLS